MKTNKDTVLGYSTKGDGNGPVCVSSADRRQHLFVIGQTGTGKSTFLKSQMKQDLLAGKGFTFIDPHGADARDIIEYVPRDRVKDVIYFNPKDMEYPFGLNLLQYTHASQRDLVVDGVVSALRHLWPESWGDRMDYIIRNACYALIEEPGRTLLEVSRMLTDKGFRDHIIRRTTNPAVRHFWLNEYPTWSKFEGQATAPVQNRIGAIATNSVLRNIVGQARSTFDIRWITDNSKIFIANLSGLGEKAADILGSLLLSLYHITVLSREMHYDSPEYKAGERGDLPDHYLYIDEAHRFSSTSLAGMLVEVRKYGLSITLAQQFLKQNKSEKVRDALLGTCGMLAVFRVGVEDAQVLEMNLDPLIVKAEELTGLERGEVYLKVLEDGQPFISRTRTRQVSPAAYVGKGRGIVNYSRHNYGRPQVKIERRIKRIYAPFSSTQNHRKQIARNKSGARSR